MEGYKHTVLGWIPEDWEVNSIGNTCEICNNLRFPLSELVRSNMKGKYPYYGPTKIQGYINEYRVEGKYVLIGEDGDHFLKYKDQPMTLLVEGKFNVNNHAHLIKGDNGCLTEWIFYFYKHRDIFPFLTRQGAGRFKLTKESLLKMPLAYPQEGEQIKIVSTLNTWDKSIETLTQLIAAKKQLKKGLMQQLLTGKKRLPGFKGEWKEQKFEVIADVVMGQSPDGSTYNQECLGKPLLNGPTEFTDRYPVKIQWTSSPTKLCKKNDILLCVRGSSTGRINIANDEYCIGRGIAAIRAKGNNNHSFVEFQLKNAVLKILSLTSGSTFPNIDSSSLKGIIIMIPEIAEQRAIGRILTASEEEIEVLKNQLDFFKQQKQGLMQQLLTGKKRVKV